MKKTNKGFTLVELIIVIAVIGVLAAILIPTFANVIDKANRKSAFSDAKNALQIYLAENTDGEGGAVVDDGTIFEVANKGKKTWYFVYKNSGLHEADDELIGWADINKSGSNLGADITPNAASDTAISGFPTNVKMYAPKA